MKNSTLILSILLTILAFSLHSQDVLFSQYINTPVLVNPSFTGNFEGDKRINLGYRDQWRSSLASAGYKAGFLTYDSKTRLSNTSHFGYGASAVIDRAGSLNFGTNQYNVHTAITKCLGDSQKSHHLLSAGLQMGISNTGFNSRNKTYFDLGSGLLWEYKTAKDFGIQLGAAVFHLNKPNISIVSGNNTLYSRYNIHAMLNLQLTKRIDLKPTLLSIFQGPHQENIVGLNSSYTFTPLENRHQGSIMLGFYCRVGKDISDSLDLVSLNFISSLQLGSTTFGLSYDYFLNGFGGTFEITAGYIFRRRRNKGS